MENVHVDKEGFRFLPVLEAGPGSEVEGEAPLLWCLVEVAGCSWLAAG